MQVEFQKLLNRFAQEYAVLQGLEPEVLEAIHRYARISSIGASTRIENAVLTDAEISWIDTVLTQDGKPTAFDSKRYLIENKLSKDRERSIEEVAGCREMLHLIYEQYRDLIPLTENNLRAMHSVLMHYYEQAGPYVGRYKGVSNSVVEMNRSTGSTRTIFETASPGPFTESAMSDLFVWYHSAMTQQHATVRVACEFVFRFLAIHPFQDGNGRLGRALFLLLLLQSPDETISVVARYLAIDRQIERHRAEYYLVLRQCSDGRFSFDPKNYKIEYFVRFMIKVLNEALDGIALCLQKFQQVQKLSASATLALSCFKDYPEIRLTTKLIMKETKLPRRTVVHALNQLTLAKLIQKYGQGAGVRYQLQF